MCVLCVKAHNTKHSEQLEEKNAHIAKSDTLLQQKEEQLDQIHSDLAKWVSLDVYTASGWKLWNLCGAEVQTLWLYVYVRAQEELALTQKACRDLSENLRRTLTEKETCDLKSSAEIDDLYRTKRNLEERLIELIRYFSGLPLNTGWIRCIWREVSQPVCTACWHVALWRPLQGERCAVAEIWRPGVWAEAASWGAVGPRASSLLRVSHAVQLVAAQTQLQVRASGWSCRVELQGGDAGWRNITTFT